MSELLDSLYEYIKEKDYNVFRVSIGYADGKIETKEMRNAAWCQNTYSLSKTFTMVAIGILYDRGLVKPEDKICDILSKYVPKTGMDERWYLSTVRHALTHSMGLPGGFLDIDCNKSSDFTDDYLDYTFKYPLDYTPGEGNKYSDGAFYVLSRVVSEISGECLDDFLWKNLFLPMDFQEAAWSHCPKGYAMGATGLYINSSDCVKLGIMLINKGVYNGKRILSEEWVNLAVDNGFGLGWDEGNKVYSKGGMFGQSLVMYPEKELSFCIQSFGADSGDVSRFIIEWE